MQGHSKEALFRPLSAGKKAVDLGSKLLKHVGYGKPADSIGKIRKFLFRQGEGLALPTASRAKYLKPTEQTAIEAAKRFARKPIAGTREALGAGKKSMGLGEKALFGGMTAMGVPGALSKEPGRSERVGKLLGSTAGWLAFRRMPLLANLLGWTAAEHLGGKVGKGLSWYAGGKSAVPTGKRMIDPKRI